MKKIFPAIVLFFFLALFPCSCSEDKDANPVKKEDIIPATNFLTLIDTIPMTAYCRGLAVRGNYLYASVSDSGFQIFDITDSASPDLAGSIPAPGQYQSMGVFGISVSVCVCGVES
ncbi:MAG: hypothetical protein A2293_03145 [Elusimicrobia bacterium RIFOXYB2_FULL_49_7]|nr:MAG: hypothetical protein A2293_03145 [Elusimicrobia bacterium RIFOXYB2_FULL_49_7]